jgi:hypothetical protein
MVGFIFGGNTGETPESLKRKREMIEQLLVGQRTPQNWGQGVGALMGGIAAGIEQRRLNKAEAAGRESGNSAFSKIFSGITGRVSPDQMPEGQVPMTGAADELAATTPGASSSTRISRDKETFVQSLLPAAIEESKRTGVDPRIIVAQAAQETGWGKSAPGNNYFGIKSHGKSGGNSMMTNEVVDGKTVRVRDSFRAYESPAESVRGYGDFLLENPRYEPLRKAQGIDAQLEALQASGYATDPNYSRSVGAIARGIELPQETAAVTPEAAFNAVMPELGGEQSLSDEVAQFEQTPAYTAQFPDMAQQGGQMGQQPAQVAQAQVMGQQQGGQQTQGMTGPSLQQLYEAAANPWLAPEQKAIVGSLIEQKLQEQQSAREEQQWRGRQDYEQQMKQRDPAYTLEQQYRQAQIEKLNREAAGGGTPELGLNPQYGVDKDGNPVLIQIGKDGRAVQTALPDGVSLSKEPIKLDAGTHFVLLDPITRQPVGTIPKENREAARETAIGSTEGKTLAEQNASAPGDYQSAENALDLLSSIRNDPYRERGTGASSVLNAIPGTSGYDFAQKVEQAKSGAFLTAIQQMKGLGALSNTEGQAATAAITRMNTAMSEEGFLSALDDYEKIVNQALARAGSRLPSRETQQSTPTRRGPVSIGGYTIEEVD